MSNLNNIFKSEAVSRITYNVQRKNKKYISIHYKKTELLSCFYIIRKFRNIYNICRGFPAFPFVRNMKERERERVRGCRMQQNLKSFPPPPPAIPKEESDLRARGLKSGYLRYQAFDAETGVTTSAARHEKRRGETRRSKARRGGAKRCEARRGETRRGKAWRGEAKHGVARRERRGRETRSRDNWRINLPRVTVALARTRISDKCVPVRAPISRGLVGDTCED